MADPGARAGAQGSAPVATGSSITFLIEAGGSEALPRSKAIVLIDPVAPQSLDLTIPNLHYGSRGPILGVLDFAQRVIGSAESVWIEKGRLQLGRWQAIFYAEFDGPRSREGFLNS